MSRIQKVLILAIAALLLGIPAAQAHPLGYDSVTAGEQLRIRKATTYDISVVNAEKSWDRVNNNYSGRGVEHHLVTSDASVIIRDYNAADGRAGFYSNACNPDCIWLNTYYLKDYSGYKRQGVAAHEIGHADRFAHPESSEYYRKNSIMFPVSADARTNHPMYHDYKDFQRTWVN